MLFSATSAIHAITKEELCQTPPFISAKISPNGKIVAQVGANLEGITNVSIFSLDNPTDKQPLSFFDTPDIIQFFWSPDSKKILLLKDENGSGQLNLYGFDIQSRKQISYAKNSKVLKISKIENTALIGLNHRNPHFHDLFKLDLNSGKLTSYLENDSFAKFLINDALEIVLKMKINSDGSWTILTNDNTLFMTLSSEEAFQTEFLSHDAKNNEIYFLDNRSTNTNQLTKKGMASPYPEKVLGSDAKSDIDDVIFIEGKPEAYATYYTQKKWHVLGNADQKDIDFLVSHIGSNFEVVSQSDDNAVWLVQTSLPHAGTTFWAYKRASQTLTQLAPASARNDFSHMYELVTKARDGKELICYYTLPKDVDKGGYVDKPLPLVVVPHGGPFKVRDKFEFNPFHQWLASCGYAVLSVNFRLSSGFGKEFVNAGNGEWGGKAHLDVIDGVEACIASGLTEHGKIAIFGGSYGGYESLAALTFTPGYFRCCIAVCGPSNLKTVLASVPQFWEFTSKPLSDKLLFFTKQAFITSMGGNPETSVGAAYLEKCSPLNYLDNIRSPLLLIHGKNDHVVSENESRQIYEKMKKNNLEVTYVVFPDEGHRPARFENKLFYHNETELFLSKHLHGTYQPANKEHLSKSSAIIFK